MLELYDIDNGAYPTTEQSLKMLVVAPSGLAIWRGPRRFETYNTLVEQMKPVNAVADVGDDSVGSMPQSMSSSDCQQHFTIPP